MRGVPFAAVIFGRNVFQVFFEVGFELLDAGLAFEGFIEAEEREDYIRAGFAKPIVGRAEVFRAVAGDDFIARSGEVADDQFVLWILGVDIALEPAIMLNAIGEGIADNGDVIAFVELEARGGIGCG